MKTAPGDAGLVRALGVWGLAASIVNIVIGGGIFRAPGSAEVSGRLGAAAPLAYVTCALAMAFVVMCFAEAGRRVSLTGGPYAYVARAFGGFAGFMTGWFVWITGTIATAAVATIFADNFLRLVPGLPAVPGRALAIVTVFAAATTVNVLGVRLGARLNVVSTIVKLTPLALLIVVGIFSVRPEFLVWESAPPIAEVTRASVFLIFVFAGIEAALVPSGEVKDPQRTVPRAVFAALALVAIIYMLVQIVAQGLLGPSLTGRAAPLSDAAEVVMGAPGAMLLSVGVVLSTFGYLCGMILAIPRALFAFGRDGVLPTALAAVHGRFRTPWIAIIVQSLLTMLLALSSGFEPLVILANLTVLIVYLACAAAAWKLRRQPAEATATVSRPLPGSALAPPLAILIIVGLLTSIRPGEWVATLVALLAGLTLYWFSRLRSRSAAPAQP